MKKICIIRHGYYPDDVRVRKQALALTEKGYKVNVICLKLKNEKKREVVNGINIYRLPVQHQREGVTRYLFEYSAFFFLSAIMLTTLYFRNRYDFIQVNTLPDFLVFITIIPKLFGAKIILDLHEPAPELWCSIFGFKRIFFFNLIKFFEQKSIRYTDHAITVSEQMKNNFIRRGAEPSKISVILNVPNNKEFHPELDKCSECASKDKKFILLSHGTIIKRYGQDVAIKAIALLKKEIPNIQLNILGYGDYEAELKQLVSHLGLDDYAHFCGYLPFDEMVDRIMECDIGIVPVEKNDYSDLVHTNKMFEFIAVKKPVIVSRTKAVENFFGSDDSCLKYFESGDEKDFARCVIELYNNPAIGRKMAERAFEKYMPVNWETTKEEYCLLF